MGEFAVTPSVFIIPDWGRREALPVTDLHPWTLSTIRNGDSKPNALSPEKSLPGRERREKKFRHCRTHKKFARSNRDGVVDGVSHIQSSSKVGEKMVRDMSYYLS